MSELQCAHSPISPSLRLYYLQHMGIDTWIDRKDCVKSRITLMVISDALGDEISQNRKEARLLKQMFTSIGLSDQDVSFHTLTNYPEQCTKLVTQIGVIQPRVIVALGSLVQQWFETNGVLLQPGMYEYQDIPVFVTYHPAYLLQHTCDKKKAYTDLLHVSQLLAS